MGSKRRSRRRSRRRSSRRRSGRRRSRRRSSRRRSRRRSSRRRSRRRSSGLPMSWADAFQHVLKYVLGYTTSSVPGRIINHFAIRRLSRETGKSESTITQIISGVLVLASNFGIVDSIRRGNPYMIGVSHGATNALTNLYAYTTFMNSSEDTLNKIASSIGVDTKGQAMAVRELLRRSLIAEQRRLRALAQAQGAN
jgi:hypothetical protein